MLGSTLFRAFTEDTRFITFGSVRDTSSRRYFSPEVHGFLIDGTSLHGDSGLLDAFASARPDVVINCVGIIKQLPSANDYLHSLDINATLPHRLIKYCDAIGARLVHFSTDCVFSGEQGSYTEKDVPDAHDLYGRTKLLGEVDYGNCLTLRTSIIGHELSRAKSLVDWFLSQERVVKGYRNAVFSGLPTIEIARVLKNYVIPTPDLRGLYHLSVESINKYELLRLIANIYEKEIEVIPDDEVRVDRSLNSDRFRSATGYRPAAWPSLIEAMHAEYIKTRVAYD